MWKKLLTLNDGLIHKKIIQPVSVLLTRLAEAARAFCSALLNISCVIGPGAAGAPADRAGVLKGVAVAADGVVGILRGALVGSLEVLPLLLLRLLLVPVQKYMHNERAQKKLHFHYSIIRPI